MVQNPDPEMDIESPEVLSVVDELSLWSAPFGLRLLDTVRCSPRTSALDIGSGTGFPLTELAMRLGSTSVVYGIDPWYGGVRRTREKIEIYGLDNAAIIHGHAENLPFRDGSFDLVTSNNGINNVQNPRGALAEISRVSKPGTQFVFTFNTDDTFAEFYETFRETLYALGIPQFIKTIREHIQEKRKPVAFMENMVTAVGFRVISIRDDMFSYRFADAASMMKHFFFRLAFEDNWRNILPADGRKKVFRELEKRLDGRAKSSGELRMRVPFVVFDCERA
ncbi:MAG: class I SAM-dependent methyltransferase [Bacteroidetes bacterium]|nr:class I SAM-dependent methyltransferase [Bacteroidota bacterium]